MAKKKTGVFTKYDYVPGNYRRISEESNTVPDLVLSMAEIYRKYAVTGDISALPGRVRPVYVDNGSEFDDSFESEEATDTYLHVQDLRESVGKSYTKKTPASPAEEDINTTESPKGDESNNQPDNNDPSDGHDANERSEAKE